MKARMMMKSLALFPKVFLMTLLKNSSIHCRGLPGYCLPVLAAAHAGWRGGGNAPKGGALCCHVTRNPGGKLPPANLDGKTSTRT